MPQFGQILFLLAIALAAAPTTRAGEECHSPCAAAAPGVGDTLFVACSTAARVLKVNVATLEVRPLGLTPSPPSGLTITADGLFLFITCGGVEGQVAMATLPTGKLVGNIPVGHTPLASVLSPDGRRLFVCNRFSHDVSVIDVPGRKELRRIPVVREPVAAALAQGGGILLVANSFPCGRADSAQAAAVVSAIDTAAENVVSTLRLPNCSASVTDVRVAPDGRFAVVTHLLSRLLLPADQVERGWMNANAITLIDCSTLEIVNTVLLDEPQSGAANPSAAAWSKNGKWLLIAHAGTHEVSVIDFPGLMRKLQRLPAHPNRSANEGFGASARCRADVPSDLTFLAGLRRRIKLPAGDRGPRALLVAGSMAYTANYFSDTLTGIDLASGDFKTESIPLGPKPRPTLAAQGEAWFHDATICLQGWQSCASCHPGDARADGFNWDLLNDGIGNPKNTKSLLLAFETPPAMSLGVRETARDAIRSGIRHILFTSQPDSVADAIGEYIKSLKPVPSPYLIQGRLSASAERGQAVFARAGCATCHPPPLFTDLRPHDVGTRAAFDKPADQFDTPALVELWRTAPYLHDGSAATIGEVITTRNARDQHGVTANLSPREVADLCAYLLSL